MLAFQDVIKKVCILIRRRSHIQGNSATLNPQLRAKSRRMDAKLQRMSVKPSFKRGKSMTRGTPVSPPPQASFLVLACSRQYHTKLLLLQL